MTTPLRLTWRINGIYSLDGYPQQRTDRAHCTFIKLVKSAKYTIKDGYEFCAFQYDLSSYPAIYQGAKINYYTTSYIASDESTVVFVVRNKANSTIEDLTDIEMYIESVNPYLNNKFAYYNITKTPDVDIDRHMVLVGNNAVETSNSSYATTDFVEVNSGDVILVDSAVGGTFTSNNYSGLYGYDNDKNLVNTLLNLKIAYGWANFGFLYDAVCVFQKYPVFIPDGVKYIRLSSRINGNDGIIPTIYSANQPAGNTLPIGNFLPGSLNAQGNETIPENTEANDTRLRTYFIELRSDKLISIKSNGQKVAYCLYDSNKLFLLNSGWKACDFIIKPVKNACYTRIVVANIDDSSLTRDDIVATFESIIGYDVIQEESSYTTNGFTNTPYTNTLKVIMHRGYNSIAPENTIPAFKLAKQFGFGVIETDIQLTSDNIPVIIHDSSVDRTSNGTGTVYNMTLLELKSLDFGSWKSTMWEGTTIPTLEETLNCCKHLGLEVYLEIKRESPWTQTTITDCVNLVKQYGLLNHVTWISFSETLLNYVKTAYAKSRLGFIMTTYTKGAVDTCLALKTSENNVIAVTRYDLLSNSVLEYMIENDIPLSAYMFDSEGDGNAIQSYVSEVLTNEFNVAEYIYRKNIEINEI